MFLTESCSHFIAALALYCRLGTPALLAFSLVATCILVVKQPTFTHPFPPPSYNKQSDVVNETGERKVKLVFKLLCFWWFDNTRK